MEATVSRTRGSAAGIGPRLILPLAAVLIVAAAVAVVVIRGREHAALNLTGNWVAQDGVVTVALTLTGNNDHLTGTLSARNAPLPIKGTVTAQVTGATAHVRLHALGQNLTARCTVSSSKMVCTGTGGNTTLTLTFTRP